MKKNKKKKIETKKNKKQNNLRQNFIQRSESEVEYIMIEFL